MSRTRKDHAPTASAGAAHPSRFKRGRKPHNAAPATEHENVAELVQSVGSEPRKVLVAGRTVEMSRAERMLRLQIERAMQGKARDVTDVLRLMVKHPDMGCSFRTELVIVISGMDAHA